MPDDDPQQTDAITEATPQTSVRAVDILARHINPAHAESLRAYVISRAAAFRAFLATHPRSARADAWQILIDAISGELNRKVSKRTLESYLSCPDARAVQEPPPPPPAGISAKDETPARVAKGRSKRVELVATANPFKGPR